MPELDLTTIITWRSPTGEVKRLEDMTRDELIEAVRNLVRDFKAEQMRHMDSIDIFGAVMAERHIFNGSAEFRRLYLNEWPPTPEAG